MVVSDNFQNPADVVFVVEGTANLGGYIDTLLKHYIIPSLEVFNGGPPDPTDYGHDYSCTLYHLVTFFAADISPDTASRCSRLTTNIHEFITWLENIPFIGGGGETCSHIAEGLSTALHVFDDIQERRKNTGGAAQRHCILVCNSPPYQLPSQEGVRYVGFTADQLANMMAQRGINLSIISPRKIAALQKLYEEANPPGENGMNIKDFTTDPRHHVLLHGYQLEERSHSPGTDSYTTDKQQLDQKPAHSPSFAIPGSRSFSPAPMPSFGDSQAPGGEFKVPSAAPTASTSSLLNTQQPSPHSQSQPSPQQIQRQQDNQLQQQSQLQQQQNQLQQNQLVQQQNQMQQQQNQLQQQQQQQQQNQLQAGQQQIMQQQLLKQQQQQQQQSQASMVNPPMSQGMQNPSNNLQASMANQTPVSLQPSLASQTPLNMPRQTLHPRQFSDPVPTKADQLQNMGPRMTHTNIMTPAQTSQMNIMTSQAKLQQSNAMPGMTQSSAMPGLSQSNQMPGMTQPNTVPGMSQSNTMPGMSQSNQMPGMSQSNQMPGLAQSNQMPGMSQPNQVPGMTQANQMPGMSQPNQMPGMSQSNQMPGMTQSNPMSNMQNMPVSSGVGVLNPTGQQQTFAPQNVTNDPALGQQGQGLQGPPAQMRDRKIIWAGMLEWQEKMKAGSPQIPKVSRQLQCHLSIGPNDPEINASNWPKDLMMQLIPQSLLNSTQLQPLFKNSRQVAFHFGNHNLDSLKNLYRVMGTGFAGCVHFPNSAQCEVRVLLLLFSNKRKAFIGLIPNDQTAFVNGIRNVIFTHKRMQQNKMANNMMQSQQPQQPNVQFPGQQGGMVTQGMVTQGMSNIQMQQQPQNTMQTPIMSTQQGNLAIQQKMQQAQLAKQQEQVNQQKLLAQQRLQSQQQQQQRLHLHQQQQQLNQQNLNPQNLTQLLMQQQQVPQIRQPQMMMSQQRGPGTMPPQGQQGVMSGNIPNTMQQMTQPGPSSGPAGGQTGYDDLNLDFI